MSQFIEFSENSPPKWMVIAWGWALITLSGCGQPVAAGGTEGVFRYAGRPMSDVQITVYQQSAAGTFEAVGFGVPVIDGSFELYQPDAAGPLWLLPGDYRLTLESAGSPIEIPLDYTSPASTPLRIGWSDADRILDIEVPEKSLTR